MSNANQETKPTKYIIQVKNHLDSNWEQWFEGMTITHIDGGITILSGDVRDQSALFGLLETLHNLNLSLILVQKVNLE